MTTKVFKLQFCMLQGLFDASKNLRQSLIMNSPMCYIIAPKFVGSGLATCLINQIMRVDLKKFK